MKSFMSRNNSDKDLILKLISGYSKNARILLLGDRTAFLDHYLDDRDFFNVELITGEVNSTDYYNLDFDEYSFDFVIAIDLLQRLSYDCDALREWRRVLKSGGKLIVLAPAFYFLWSCSDNNENNLRRYTQDRLFCVLKTARFRVLRVSNRKIIQFFILLAYSISKRLLRIGNGKPGNYKLVLNPLLAMFDRLTGKLENILLMKINSFIGSGLFAIAHKD